MSEPAAPARVPQADLILLDDYLEEARFAAHAGLSSRSSELLHLAFGLMARNARRVNP